MPTRERAQALVAMVQANQFVEAIEEFYAEDASMQENQAPKRVGRAALVAHEQAMLAVTRINTLAGTCLVDGDRSVVQWRFEITDPAGRRFELDELAYQRWQGDRIVEERFYFDPAQLAGRARPAD
ncbi:MAG TPA: nuclear transport factor 2 family protein [Aliidongia sp.]|uniref:nuclear transport factor 2 family protein n=1 Tax=Aliidongia sp. TaxID=1914230 RepID=UPI002DDD9B9A|nr:nuclear transport factor 2 family protein [Aliidongia sp.]HEV2677033.1 nuclear transport factor 2 family protein [Aliidongia sp.]